MKPMQARYNIFCNEGGGAHDDTIFYRLERGWLLVVNASNAEKMWTLLNDRLPTARESRSRTATGRGALIAIQGPRSVEMLQPHVDVDLGAMRYYFCAEGRVNGVPAVIARTGYTGEDGFELFVDALDARRDLERAASRAPRRRSRTVRARRARRAAARGRHAALRARADRGDHAGASRIEVGAQARQARVRRKGRARGTARARPSTRASSVW